MENLFLEDWCFSIWDSYDVYATNVLNLLQAGVLAIDGSLSVIPCVPADTEHLFIIHVVLNYFVSDL